jgi:carotenoid 1,2-hydratase
MSAHTVPLYTVPPNPDAWHQVTSPGGYEWWYFDAEDDTGSLQIVAIFLEGFVFHPGYLRRYARFLRNPTRTQPPLAGDHPCAYCVVYENGRIISQFMSEYAPSAFRASVDRPEVAIGPNTLRRDDGSRAYDLSLSGTPWMLTWQGPKRLDGRTLRAQLRFAPVSRHPAMERVFLSRQLSGAEHHWVIADPLCAVGGDIEVPLPDGTTRTIQFKGRGYHDHNYGTAPIGPGLRRWIWGRAISADGQQACTFHFARAKDRTLPDEVHVVVADPTGRREEHVQSASVDWSRRTAMGLAYPAEVSLGALLKLSRPRVIDSAPFYMRLIYDAVLPGGQQTTAFCEVAYPHRLRWPVLGRMIEMSIHRVPVGR